MLSKFINKLDKVLVEIIKEKESPIPKEKMSTLLEFLQVIKKH